DADAESDPDADAAADAESAADASEDDEDGEEAPLPGSDSEKGPGLEKARPGSVSEEHLKTVLESLIFVSDKPVPARRLARVARTKTAEVRKICTRIMHEYEPRGIHLVELAGGYQFRSSPANAPFVREIVAQKPIRLTRAQLETLAIAAYRQPLTRPELEEIRGVDSGSALKVLLDRGVLKILGRKDEPGRPLLYGTTPFFLEFFGLNSLDELPTLKEFSELTDESRALFARKTGEDIESIADIEVPDRV
ncbi:MAG TPA: SMC-Scp complex subunit ScpB, partial [Myxococcales bacterium]|nr:SMC-Scp complex subunit ScpB [Myxococcales bacterium]